MQFIYLHIIFSAYNNNNNNSNSFIAFHIYKLDKVGNIIQRNQDKCASKSYSDIAGI